MLDARMPADTNEITNTLWNTLILRFLNCDSLLIIANTSIKGEDKFHHSEIPFFITFTISSCDVIF